MSVGISIFFSVVCWVSRCSEVFEVDGCCGGIVIDVIDVSDVTIVIIVINVVNVTDVIIVINVNIVSNVTTVSIAKHR